MSPPSRNEEEDNNNDDDDDNNRLSIAPYGRNFRGAGTAPTVPAPLKLRPYGAI